jgi:hypothetical protein
MKRNQTHKLLIFTFLIIASLVFSAPLSLASDTVPAASTNIGQDGGTTQTTEEALASAVVPARNLNDLAERLLGIEDIPEAPDTPRQQYEIGDLESFWVQNDATGVLEVKAELAYLNDRVYVWVEQGQDFDVSSAQTAVDIFAESIYRQMHDVFGSEASPGIDGDPRLHILHTAQLGPGIAGYFYSNSQYSELAVPTSNEREMFFVSPAMIDYGREYYLGLLTHEFQHMIHWAIDANEESWLNEGLSELAVYLAGYGIGNFSMDYLAEPDTQLTYWPETRRGRIYGGGYLFTTYLYERYGEEAIKMLVANPSNGMASVDETLAAIGATDPATGEPMMVEDFYADWSVANYLKNPGVAEGRYGYEEPGIQALPAARVSSTIDSLPVVLEGATVNQWGTNYYVVSGGDTAQTYQLTFEGQDSVRLLPAEGHSGTHAFWSNRVNQSNPRLTRSFDLSEVDSATLTYWTWYDIETEWDYAYLVVSTDNGDTWEILPTAQTTLANQHGTSYGHGYTGSSGDWMQEIVDLSPFAGQEILVRFEYVTDDATLGNGFLLDDIAIPEIGYAEDFEDSDGGWLPEGWVRVENRLRQPYVLQVISQYADGSVEVERLLSADEPPQGTWEVELGGEVREIVITLSGMAPLTTEAATFDLSLTPLE